MAYTSPIQHLIISLPSPLALAIFASQLAFCHELCDEIETNMLRRHENWIAKHGRVYEDMKEKERRYMIFKNNVKLIEAFNKRTGQMYTLSVNRFADMTNEEFRAIYNGYKKQYYPSKAVSSSLLKASRFNNVSDLPDFVDWREQGCCWAFSAVAATEGITKLKTGILISLSEQQLVERNTNRDDHGCKGGLMSSAFQFIQDSGGLTTEANYTYKGLYGSCNTQRAASPAATISGHENVPDNDEQALLQAVSHQPVSVAVDAGSYAFLFYSSEVLAGPCGTNLNHDVAAVGYGTTVDGIKYWLVKNSWGTSWGESGYVRMKRDVSAKEGPCGIAMEASYPTVLNILKERTVYVQYSSLVARYC